MRRVYKYPAVIPRFSAPLTLGVPEGIRWLKFDEAHQGPTLWAEVDDEAPLVTVELQWFATGDPVAGQYIATCFDGPYVWHLYDVTGVQSEGAG